MKKSIFLAFMLLSISFIYAQQAKPSCSLILCNKVEKNDNGQTMLDGLFSGFKESALNSTQEFNVYLVFRGYEINKPHVHYTKLVHHATNTTNLETNKSSFILNGVNYSHSHTHTWEVNFKYKGLYYISVYVDDVEVQRTYFSIED
jgi:hypothetical protein